MYAEYVHRTNYAERTIIMYIGSVRRSKYAEYEHRTNYVHILYWIKYVYRISK